MTTTSEVMFRNSAATPSELVPDGGRLLDEAVSFVSRFAVLPSAACVDAVVLWAAHSHSLGSFNASPRLAFLSEGPGSGKTRAMELTALLSHDPELLVDPTGPVITTLIAQRRPTLFLDECDMIWGRGGGESHRSLKAVLNSGYRAGASVPRRSGGGYVNQPIFSAVAFGGLGVLPSTLMSRSVVVRMARRKPEQRIESFYPRLHAPVGAGIGQALGSWVSSVGLDLATAWPSLPDGIADRAAEVWEPLISVADLAGGSWPERARAAAVELALDQSAEPVESPGQRIMRDLRTVWGDAGNQPTRVLVERLFALPGAPWKHLWPAASAPRELSALLAPFGIGPIKIRDGDRTCQGYRHLDFQRLWAMAGNSTDTEFSTTLVMSGGEF